MPKMRAKLRVTDVKEHMIDGQKNGETLSFNAVAAPGYDETGKDENNTFARWTPTAECSLYVANPDLFGQFHIGEEYYVDFTQAEVAQKAAA